MVDRLRENVVYPYCRFAELRGDHSAEVASACTLTKEDRHAVPIYAVMGNHDAISSESKQLQCGEVSDYVSNWYMPCGFTETIEIPGGLSLILFDSAQFAHAAEIEELMQTIKASKGPWRLLAAHRPVAVDGDDRPAVKGYVHDAVRVSGVPVHAYLSGHNHSLQIHVTEENGSPLQAIAGSGARARPPIAGDAPSRRFGVSRLGFARVDLVERDSVQRLEVSLFQSPDYPILGWGPPKRVAHWSIGMAGDVRNEMARETTGEDG